MKTKKPGKVQWAKAKQYTIWKGSRDTGKDCKYVIEHLKYGNYIFRVKGDNAGYKAKGWKAKTLKKY